MLNDLSKQIHENFVKNGFWDEQHNFLEVVALCHSELSKAVTEYMDGKPFIYFPCNAGGLCCEENGRSHCGSKPYNSKHPNSRCSAQSKEPNGIAVEMVDCLIRILGWFGSEGLDVDEILQEKMVYLKNKSS